MRQARSALFSVRVLRNAKRISEHTEIVSPTKMQLPASNTHRLF